MKYDIKGRYIKRNNGRRIPRYILTFDTETEYTVEGNEQKHRMKIAWSVLAHVDQEGSPTHETWRYWSKRYPLCEYIDSMALLVRELTIIGNNIFFDLQVCGFFSTMPELGWGMDFIYENGMTYILCLKKEGCSIKCISLTNYFEASVETLGKMIGKEKLSVDFATVDADTLAIYCFRDTEITYESFLHYLSYIVENDLGNFAMTRASQSMRAFRHRFMKDKLLYHDDETISKLELASYFGGRTECFRLGEIEGAPFVDLDVNSLYPFIMKTCPVPIRPIDYYSSLGVSDLEDVLKSFGAIARVTIETDEPLYPYREGAKVIFPIGRFETSLCSESLRIALARGDIVKVSECAVYEMGYPFIEYIDYFYGKRLEARADGNSIYDKMAKLFMNSLYGKFAQKRDIIVLKGETEIGDYMRDEIYDPVTNENQIITRIFGTVIVTQGREVIPGSIISIPSHITEYARNYLWKLIQVLGRNRVFYCDTDSLKINRSDIEFYRPMIHGSELGKLKIEKEYGRLKIHGPKDYETDDDRRLKGVPRNAEKIDENTWSYNQFARHISHLREGNSTYFSITKVTKKLKRIYTKGRVNSDSTISPWVYPMDERKVQSFR